MHQRTPAPTIAVSEWVNGLELRVSNRTLRDHRQIITLDELKQIRHRASDQLRLRTDMSSATWRITIGTNPYQIGTVRTRVFSPTSLSGEQGLMHGKNIVFRHAIAQLQRSLHGTHIANHDRRIVARALINSFQRKILRTDRQIFYLGRRRSFRAQQHRAHWTKHMATLPQFRSSIGVERRQRT